MKYQLLDDNWSIEDDGALFIDTKLRIIFFLYFRCECMVTFFSRKLRGAQFMLVSFPVDCFHAVFCHYSVSKKIWLNESDRLNPIELKSRLTTACISYYHLTLEMIASLLKMGF